MLRSGTISQHSLSNCIIGNYYCSRVKAVSHRHLVSTNPVPADRCRMLASASPAIITVELTEEEAREFVSHTG